MRGVVNPLIYNFIIISQDEGTLLARDFNIIMSLKKMKLFKNGIFVDVDILSYCGLIKICWRIYEYLSAIIS